MFNRIKITFPERVGDSVCISDSKEFCRTCIHLVPLSQLGISMCSRKEMDNFYCSQFLLITNFYKVFLELICLP